MTLRCWHLPLSPQRIDQPYITKPPILVSTISSRISHPTPTAPEVIINPQEVALPMSPVAVALPPPSPPPASDSDESVELESRPATPKGRKELGSNLSDDAKANVRRAVRNILDKGHTDKDECFCLVTGLSSYEYPLNYVHIVSGATASGVSLLSDTWFYLLTGL